MKLEWGKKVYCPSCALPFYSMQKTSLVCPNCGNKFDISELHTKKTSNVAMDEITDTDEKIALSGFEFMEEEADVDVGDDSNELTDDEVMEDIKLVDEE